MKKEITTITATEAATNTNINNQEEKDMKKELFAAEAATTENIKNQEEKVMKKDVLKEKRDALVYAIEEWYCNCDELLQNLLELNNWDRPEDFAYRDEIQKIFTLTDYSHGAYYDPVRDNNAVIIKEAIQAYVKKQPESYFEEIEDKELIDIMLDAYWETDIDIVETEYRKFGVIKAVQDAPAEVFSEDEDEAEELREKLIDFYSSEPALRFEDYKYDENMDYDIYETMQDDMNSRAFLVY